MSASNDYEGEGGGGVGVARPGVGAGGSVDDAAEHDVGVAVAATTHELQQAGGVRRGKSADKAAGRAARRRVATAALELGFEAELDVVLTKAADRGNRGKLEVVAHRLGESHRLKHGAGLV